MKSACVSPFRLPFGQPPLVMVRLPPAIVYLDGLRPCPQGEACATRSNLPDKWQFVGEKLGECVEITPLGGYEAGRMMV